MANEIKFVVLGDVKDLEKKLDGTKKAFDKVAKVSAVAFTAMTASAYGFIEAARKQETAINALNQALANQGNYSLEVSKDLQKYASALQEVSLFGDETIIKSEAIIASFGFEGEILKKLTKATLDLAQAKGMDLSAAADLVGKSVGSTTNAMARYGIQIDGVAGSSARAQSAIDGLTRLYGGQAEAATKGLGATIVLKNAMSDLGEEIGMALSPAVLELTRNIKSFVDYTKQNPEITKMAADFLLLGIKISGAALAFSVLGKVVIQAGIGIAALSVQLAFLNSVQIAGLSTSVGVLIKNVGLLYPGIMIAAAGWAGWEIGKLIGQIPIVEKFLDRVLGEVPTENRAMRNGRPMTLKEEKKVLNSSYSSGEIADKTSATAEKIRLQNEYTSFMETNAAQLLAISSTTTQAELDDLILKLQQSRDSEVENLLLKQQMLTDAGILQVGQETAIQEEIKAVKDRYNTLVEQAKQQSQNKMNEIEKKGLELYKQVNQDKIGSLESTLLQAAQLNSKFANLYKAVAIGQVIMYTGMAVMRAFAENNFWVALGISALLSAKSAVEIANISAQSFDVGTSSVPEDMVANVHKDEMIVPATFAEGIRSGELALSGGAGGGAGIIFDFSGSQFNGVNESSVREWFQKASEMISNRTLSPLPAV